MNTRKYSRTMAEAFGPYTSNQLEPMPEDDAVTDVALVLASVAAVALAVVSLFVWGLV
jgi:hypothetical protein